MVTWTLGPETLKIDEKKKDNFFSPVVRLRDLNESLFTTLAFRSFAPDSARNSVSSMSADVTIDLDFPLKEFHGGSTF